MKAQDSIQNASLSKWSSKNRCTRTDMTTSGVPLIAARPCPLCKSDGVNRVVSFLVGSARRRQQWQMTDEGNDRQKIIHYLGSPMRDLLIPLTCDIT